MLYRSLAHEQWRMCTMSEHVNFRPRFGKIVKFGGRIGSVPADVDCVAEKSGVALTPCASLADAECCGVSAFVVNLIRTIVLRDSDRA